MEAKRFLTIFREDSTVLGVNFDPALDFGLYLFKVVTPKIKTCFATAAL
jgi:hypothetical protein